MTLMRSVRSRQLQRELFLDGSAAGVLLVASLLYGNATAGWSNGNPSTVASSESLGTFVLVQRRETVEYAQALGREQEM